MNENEFEKSNSLIKSKKSIFAKIKEKIQLLTKKDELKKIDPQWLEDFRKIHEVKNTNEKISKNEKTDLIDEETEYAMYEEFEELEDEFENEVESIEDKNEFFELYNKVKKTGKMPKNISTKDLLRINEMLKKEIDLKKEYYKTEEFDEVENEIKVLEKEDEELTRRIKNLKKDAGN